MKGLLVIVTVLLLVMSSCSLWNTSKLKFSDKVGEEVSKGAEKYLGCENGEAVSSDVSKKVDTWLKVERESSDKVRLAGSQKGLVSSLCKAAVGVALPALIDFGAGKLPDSWECSGEPLEPLLDKVAMEACDQIKV